MRACRVLVMENKEQLQELLNLYKTLLEIWLLRSRIRSSLKRKMNFLELLEQIEEEIDDLMKGDEGLREYKENI